MIAQYSKQLLSIIFFVLYCLHQVSSASEINLSRSKLVQLALHLERADKEKQYYFTQIALYEMFDSYQQEVERSISDPPKTPKRKRDIYRWRSATRAYIHQLDSYLYLMDSGDPINFFMSPQKQLFIIISNTAVIISGPNSGADKQMETNIVDQFCSQYDCQIYFSHTSNESRYSQLSSDDVETEWLFERNNKMSFTMSNGLNFQFSDIVNRPSKEYWSINVSNELNLLLDYLSRVQKKGQLIDWLSMRIVTLPLTDNAYKVIINDNNHYIKLPLPLLGRHPDLFHVLIPWIKNHLAENIDYRIQIRNADQYLLKGKK
ncbi:MAG: hypothetical protein KAI02_04855 [Gammaproteobacteria bacterium]|nr:hypothetical protein [Gammaproteobacteria bacterium]